MELTKNHCYNYILFESGNNGYVIKEEHRPFYYKDLENEYHQIRDFIDLRMYQGYSDEKIMGELKFQKSYQIKTHREEINPNNDFRVCNFQYGRDERNVIYYMETLDRIQDFSKIPRYDESRHVLFLSNIINPEGFEDSTELYLN